MFWVTTKEQVMNRELSGDTLSLVKRLNPSPLMVLNLENELWAAQRLGSFWFRGHICKSLPVDAQFIVWGSLGIPHSAFCEEGAGKQALRQSLGLLLQGFSGENTYIKVNFCCGTQALQPP